MTTPLNLPERMTADYMLKTYRPDLGDLRKTAAGNSPQDAFGVMPHRHDDGFQINIDAGFLWDKEIYEYTKSGRPLYRSRVDPVRLKQMASHLFAGGDFTTVPWALERFCKAHHIDHDLYLAWLADPETVRTKAWTDTNAARLSQADSMRTAVITRMKRDPEYFLIPRMEVSPLEGDTTDSTPQFTLRPRISAFGSGAALLHMSSASDSTMTTDALVSQLIPRLYWLLTIDELGIDLAALHGTDVLQVAATGGTQMIATAMTANFYYATLATNTMTPKGINGMYDSTNNGIAIGGANATLDATTLPKLYEAIDTTYGFGEGGAMGLFMHPSIARRLEALDRSDRQYIDVPGSGFGRRVGTFDAKGIIKTDNLGVVEDINGTTFTGSDGSSIWGLTLGGEGVWVATFPGFGGPRVSVTRATTGQPTVAVAIEDRCSQVVVHPRSIFRMWGSK